jgi:hypothetical protein
MLFEQAAKLNPEHADSALNKEILNYTDMKFVSILFSSTFHLIHTPSMIPAHYQKTLFRALVVLPNFGGV